MKETYNTKPYPNGARSGSFQNMVKVRITLPTGVDLDLFKVKARNWEKDKIKILIEGNCLDDYKNVDESFKIVELLNRQKYEIIYLTYKNKV